MERLKARNNFVLDNAINAFEHTVDSALDRCTLDFLKELRKYRELEEQGLLLRLKAGVGRKVYDADGNEYIVKHFTYYSYFEPHFEYEAINDEGVIWRFKDIHFGRFVFLTKEEAEQVLKQMGE